MIGDIFKMFIHGKRQWGRRGEHYKLKNDHLSEKLKLIFQLWDCSEKNFFSINFLDVDDYYNSKNDLSPSIKGVHLFRADLAQEYFYKMLKIDKNFFFLIFILHDFMGS